MQLSIPISNFKNLRSNAMDRTHKPLVSVMRLLAALAAMARIAPSSWAAGVQAVNGCNSNGFSYSTAML